MKSKWIWFAAAATLAACNCDGENNNGDTDTGAADMMQPDEGGDEDMTTPDGGEPDGGDMGSDMNLPDGVSIPGLDGPVTVRFDEHGVLHTSCQTDADCFAAQGYYHAAHRFIQMDVQRRFTRGRISGLIGNAALGVDESMRAIMSTRDGEPLEQALWDGASEDTRAGITAYTRGVNAFLDDARNDRNGARLSEEYDLELIESAEIPAWDELDSIACGLLLLESLSNSSGGDLRRGEDYAELTADQAFDLLGTMSATQVATMPASGETYDRVQALTRWPDAAEMRPAMDRLRSRRAIVRDAYQRLSATEEFMQIAPQGRASNNWVLDGSKTASGNPLLANDPHLGLQNPALWYLVELDAKTNGTGEVHVAGVSLPGLPGILLGHNEEIAWGGTVVNFDVADVYLESLTADGSAVNFDGGTVDIIEVEHEFEVARSNPVTRTLRFVPHHGPVLSYDADAGEAVSLRWTGNDARTDLDMFFGLFTASTVDDARTAIANSTSTNQNWIVADASGDIGWFPFNAVPERTWASLSMPPWLPLPGDGSAEWGDRIPVDDLPQMVNPTNGFIATANTDPFGAGFDGDPTNQPYGYLYSYGEFGGFREDAILRRIEDAGDAHTAEISRDMQGDTFLVLRDWIRPPVQTVIDDAGAGALSADAQTVWDTIADWDGTCPTGIDGRDPMGPKATEGAQASIGCTAFHYVLYALTEGAFSDELSMTRTDHDSLEALRTLVILLNDSTRLQAGDAYWDNTLTDGPPETEESIVLGAIETAAARLAEDFSATPDDWRWGRVHTVLFFSNVLNDAGFVQYNEGPYAAPGGAYAINVATPRNASERDWGFSHGPSMRHVSDFTADGIVSWWTLPGGQRHFRDSPFYDSLLDDWLAADHFEMPFRAADVEAAAEETIMVAPR